jgi:nuclear pore complex protein Nup93
VAGFLRHAHEQNLISTIEEGRRETQEEFYRVLEERSRKDWDARKKRVFEELGGRVGGENRALSEMKKSMYGKSSLTVCFEFIERYLRLRVSHRLVPPPMLACRCRAE